MRKSSHNNFDQNESHDQANSEPKRHHRLHTEHDDVHDYPGVAAPRWTAKELAAFQQLLGLKA